MLETFFWLIILQLISFLAIPFSSRVFDRLPDKGYSFSKILGLLIVGFFTWLLGLTQLIQISRLSVIIALIVLACISFIGCSGQIKNIRGNIKVNANFVITVEVLFITVFLGMALLRASIPEGISHTEQPMDLMFLSSVVGSQYFPPIDAWLAGERVSYYYLGYIFVGLMALLTGLESWVSYNLGIALYAAMTAITAFGITYNLVGLCRGSRESGILAGLSTVFLLLIASNFVGILELYRAAGGGDAKFWSTVAVTGLSQSEASTTWMPNDSAWWWWRASRVIPGAITEFPAFSFLLGDMHPHVMSLPFLLFTVALSIQLYLQQGLYQVNSLKLLWPLWLILIVSLGALVVINLWDFPVGFALVSSSILLNTARNERRIQLGKSLVLEDDLLLVGSTNGPQNDSPLPSVRVYRYEKNKWSLQQKLTADDLYFRSGFGDTIATHGNLLAIGCPDASNTGLVRLYINSQDKWLHKTTLRPPNDKGIKKFGSSVSISQNQIIVAAATEIYIFEQINDLWEIAATFIVDSVDLEPTVKLQIHGNYIAVGITTPSTGVLRIYRKARTRWRLSQEITSAEAGVKLLGQSISLNNDYLVVGGLGSVTVFERQKLHWKSSQILYPSAPSESFGESLDIDGSFIVVGAGKDSSQLANAGKIFVYELAKNGFWTAHAELVGNDTGSNASFGSTVRISNDYISVGAPGQGQGAVYSYYRYLDKWIPNGKIGGPWRFSRSFLAIGIALFSSYLLSSPFLMNFESSAKGIAPLTEILTSPLHLLFIWGVFGLLIIPLYLLLIPHSLSKDTWSPIRLWIIMIASLSPIMFWLQPIYGPILYAILLTLFGIHQLGYRYPRADEALFAYNPRLTFFVGSIVIIVGLIWDGIVSNDRGINGELLAVNRLLTVIPFAALIIIGLYSAWSLAHKDSEYMRRASFGREALTRWNGFVPVMGISSIALSLIMGTELFHVIDIFGGELKRFNTVFKLYFQSWALLSIVGGVALWYISMKFDRRTLLGRASLSSWVLILIVLIGGLSYYSFAGVSTRTSNHDNLTLNGLFHLSKSNPSKFELIKWINENTSKGTVILEGSLVPCPSNPNGCNDWDPNLGGIAAATGRPTVLGWEGHERQWRVNHNSLHERQTDVREIYSTTDAIGAKKLISKYGIQYIVIGNNENIVYGSSGNKKFTQLGSLVFEKPGLIMYKLD